MRTRILLGAAVVLIAFLVSPDAMVPVFNSADVLLIAAPIAFTAIVGWPWHKPRDRAKSGGQR